MIIYTCPKCGGQLNHYCVPTLPPIDVLKEIFNVDVHFVDEDCDENEEDE